jgi:hypothetical protein
MDSREDQITSIVLSILGVLWTAVFLVFWISWYPSSGLVVACAIPLAITLISGFPLSLRATIVLLAIGISMVMAAAPMVWMGDYIVYDLFAGTLLIVVGIGGEVGLIRRTR